MADIDEQKKQIMYRDARLTKQYDAIWQSVGKCVFCDLHEKYIFFEENGIVLTINLHAYIDGHFLIVPRRHITSAKEFTQVEWDTVRKFTYIAKKIIRDVHGIKGMQLVQKDGANAQSTVDHIHYHCIPFDSPDLCTWNYRKLSYTPLENVGLYRQASKRLIAHTKKFDAKYKNPSGLQVVCDLLIINTKNQILFQKRAEWARLVPDVLTIPGGIVDDFSVPLEHELAREVREETGWAPDLSNISLHASRIAHIKQEVTSAPLATKYALNRDFVWNTYIYHNFDETTPLVPSDDCEALVWIDIKDVAGHERISEGIQQTVAEL